MCVSAPSAVFIVYQSTWSHVANLCVLSLPLRALRRLPPPLLAPPRPPLSSNTISFELHPGSASVGAAVLTPAKRQQAASALREAAFSAGARGEVPVQMKEAHPNASSSGEPAALWIEVQFGPGQGKAAQRFGYWLLTEPQRSAALSGLFGQFVVRKVMLDGVLLELPARRRIPQWLLPSIAGLSALAIVVCSSEWGQKGGWGLQ